MYHAVGNNQQIDGSDPHYAVTESNFLNQILRISKSVPIANQKNANGNILEHCITFDDGHLSNYTVAFPLLVENQLHAEFYINTNNVGKSNYMNWQQLQEMVDAGMSIQSHGHNHFYFSDLTEQEIRDELEISKRLIEENLANEVTVFAPPGGRIDQRVVRIAKEIGYKSICTSEPGVVKRAGNITLPRFAVLATTPNDKISNWKNSFSIDTLKERTRFVLFGIVKKTLGNNVYDKIRSFLLNENKESST